MAITKHTRWIQSAPFDLLFILAPQFIVAFMLIMFSDFAHSLGELPAWLWIALIVGVDVSHVYSTVFRTYLDPRERLRMPDLYRIFPLIGWVVGVMLYSIHSLYFWRVLAYLAAFHFVRQQYGFMMLYASRCRTGSPLLDKAAIYTATIYPLLYWHCYEREFHWFLAKDFLFFQEPRLASIGLFIYVAVMAVYIWQELRDLLMRRVFNLPKNLLLFATGFTWWIGIITFNNDIAFTATNVIAHGLPYLALIWIYKRREAILHNSKSCFFRVTGIPLYLGVLFLIAFLEEWVWDGVLWRDHSELFPWFWALEAPSNAVLSIVVPLLALPQLLHYIFDAFIWRLHAGDPQWKTILLGGSGK